MKFLVLISAKFEFVHVAIKTNTKPAYVHET